MKIVKFDALLLIENMYNKRRIKCHISFIGFAIGLFLNLSVVAAPKFERFSNKEGFNQNSINAIAQDKYGFLWFGTPNGLIKYDGYQFTDANSYEPKDGGISNNIVNCLFNDPSGILWIGTNVGVDVYIPWQEKYFKVPLDTNAAIHKIDVDSGGRIYFAGNKVFYICQLQNIDGDIMFEVSKNLLENKPNMENIEEFIFINERSMLVAPSRGLYRLQFELNSSIGSTTSVSLVPYANFSHLNVSAIRKIDNVYYLGTSEGLFKSVLDGDKMLILEKINLTPNINSAAQNIAILSVFVDFDGVIWVGTRDFGIFKYIPESGKKENYNFDSKDELGISSSQINCIFQDKFKVFWFGTAQGGLNKLDLAQKPFVNFFHNPYDNTTISGNLINSILEDSRGRIWIGFYNGTISRSYNSIHNTNISQLKFERLEKQFPFNKQERIISIYEDVRGYIWFGTNSSIVVYDPHNDKFKKIDLVFEGKSVELTSCFVISGIDQDRLLFGGSSINIVRDPWSQFKNKKEFSVETDAKFSLAGAMVKSYLKDKHGNHWFGTVTGLFHCNLKGNDFSIINHYSTIPKVDSLVVSNNNIFSLHEDVGGNIWVGTFGGGLNKISVDQSGNPLKIDYFRKTGLLPDDAVYGILQENEDLLWLSTDMGLCRYNISNSKVDVFDVRDGLLNNNFRQAAYFKGKSGYFYFGGLNGLSVFKPGDIKMNEKFPTVVITSLNINNKVVKVGEKINGRVLLTKSISETTGIKIGNKEQIIAFDLCAIQTTTPTRNRLEYMLEGFNDEWLEVTNGKTVVTYTNLPSGNYTFRVKGANGDGVWSNETTNLMITVLPPWYQRWWSYVILILLIVTIATSVSMYFLQLEKLKQRLKYEQVDKQRIDSINQGKLRFFTNISHEFRTPLTLIAGPLERIIERNTDPGNTRYLSAIQNNTKRLLNLVDQLITFRQAEQGYVSLNPSLKSVGNFIYPVAEAFEDYAIQKNINFFYKINSPNDEIYIDTEKTERIIFNLLSNSFKYTPSPGKISIETDVVLNAGKKMFRINVIDSGKGIPADKQARIFQRFYQLEGREENVGGTGIGLAFCKSLVEIMGGTISFESESNIRTCFTVFIPCEVPANFDAKGQSISGKSHIRNWIDLPVLPQHEPSKFDENITAHSQYKILIVEDEAEIGDFLMNSLNEKYTISIAKNGLDGLAKIKLNEPDLIVSDVMMPEMDGFEMCEKIKTDPVTCHIPVILLTALGDKENIIRGLEFGADDYISKPFSLRHLELRVEKLLENNHRIKEYFSKNSVIPEVGIEISGRDKDFLNKVIDAIESNLSDSNFGVEELAKEIGLSPSQFYRRLKQLTGQIPNGYLRNYRLQKAAELLKSNAGLNVAEVMYQIGIESSSYFSTSFKKLHGVSPSELIR